ncbi:MAG: hypothetical protein F6K28_36835 [Microcoleus sp. SIO2G3]|nr:hypothetical protein [Microcoleus sp. SIO2G3]
MLEYRWSPFLLKLSSEADLHGFRKQFLRKIVNFEADWRSFELGDRFQELT